jgi:hypothetical protein
MIELPLHLLLFFAPLCEYDCVSTSLNV